MEVGAEKVKPYKDDKREKGEQVKDMFDNIAPAYDFMNRAMTLGIDKLWRRKAVSMIKKHYGDSADSYHILDIATGTGDLAIMMADAMPRSIITGVDLSEGMIEIGRDKVKHKNLTQRIKLICADCLALPFPDNTFDCVTVAYGVRNFEHLSDGYREMLRVLRPSGMLCVIEMSRPTSPLVRPFYNLYTRHIIPVAGRLASKDNSAYTYLPESIEAVAQGSEMTAIISDAGFTDARYLTLTFGVCSIYTAIKPK